MDSVFDKYTLFQIWRDLKTTQNVLILQWYSTLVDYIEQYILTTFDIQTRLPVVDALFGIKQHNCT